MFELDVEYERLFWRKSCVIVNSIKRRGHFYQCHHTGCIFFLVSFDEDTFLLDLFLYWQRLPSLEWSEREHCPPWRSPKREKVKSFAKYWIKKMIFFLVFLRAGSSSTPKSFACLCRLVIHSNKVYKIVNDARYIILIFIHCCKLLPPPFFYSLSKLWGNCVTPAARKDFSSVHDKLSKVLYHIIFNSKMYLCVCFLGSSFYLRYSKGFLLTEHKLYYCKNEAVVAPAEPKPAVR